MLTQNQKTIRDELAAGYDLKDLRHLGTILGLTTEQMKKPGAKRTHSSYVASKIAEQNNAFTVRDRLEAMGFDVSGIILDDFEDQPPEPSKDELSEFAKKHPKEAKWLAGKKDKDEFLSSLQKQTDQHPGHRLFNGAYERPYAELCKSPVRDLAGDRCSEICKPGFYDSTVHFNSG